MRAYAFLFAGILFGFLLLQGANALLDQPLAQGFSGLQNQAGPATYTFSLPVNASYLFAGILAKEGSASMELQSGSGYSYGIGQSVIADDALPGTYTITVTGAGKYDVFWDYMKAEPPSSRCSDPSKDLSKVAASSSTVRLTQSIGATAGGPSGAYGYENPAAGYGSTLYQLPTTEQPTIFLADPVGFGIELPPPGNYIGFFVKDYSQGSNCDALVVSVKRLDSNGCYMNDLYIMEDHNWFMGDTTYSAGQKFLINVSLWHPPGVPLSEYVPGLPPFCGIAVGW